MSDSIKKGFLNPVKEDPAERSAAQKEGKSKHYATNLSAKYDQWEKFSKAIPEEKVLTAQEQVQRKSSNSVHGRKRFLQTLLWNRISSVHVMCIPSVCTHRQLDHHAHAL